MLVDGDSSLLTAHMRVLRADNGFEVTVGELKQTGERPLVWSLDERRRMAARPVGDVVRWIVKKSLPSDLRRGAS